MRPAPGECGRGASILAYPHQSADPGLSGGPAPPTGQYGEPVGSLTIMDPIARTERAAKLLRGLVAAATFLLIIGVVLAIIASADLAKDDRPTAIAATLAAALSIGLLLAGLYAFATLLELQAHRAKPPSILPPPPPPT